MLCASGALREPILYLSLYLKTHRETYYELLTGVRSKGDWETWLEFFLTAVKETSGQAVNSARRILALIDSDRRKIESLGRPAASVLRVFQHVQTSPILAIASAAEKTGMSFPTVSNSVEHLERLGILKEITGRQRSRLFVYDGYLSILGEGTDPLRP
jgi:Fic family protein